MLGVLAAGIWRASMKFSRIEFQLAAMADELKKTREEEFRRFEETVRAMAIRLGKLESFKERVRREMRWDVTPVRGVPITGVPTTRRKVQHTKVHVEDTNIYGEMTNDDEEDDS